MTRSHFSTTSRMLQSLPTLMMKKKLIMIVMAIPLCQKDLRYNFHKYYYKNEMFELLCCALFGWPKLLALFECNNSFVSLLSRRRRILYQIWNSFQSCCCLLLLLSLLLQIIEPLPRVDHAEVRN